MTATAVIKEHEVKRPEREYLDLKRSDFIWPLAFMLSMSMIGLSFPLGLLLVPLVMFHRFQNDRYDFVIQLTIFLGGYSLIYSGNVCFDLSLISFAISLVAILLLRKAPVLKKTLWLLIVYFIGLLWIVSYSDESLAVQWPGIRSYMAIIYLFVPFLVFSGREFDIRILFRHLFAYAFIFCAYYIIDCVIMGGVFFLSYEITLHVLNIFPTFYDPWLNPLSFEFPRRWPPGLYILLLLAYPAGRFYKLRVWQWLLVLGALLVCRTFTFTMALIIGYLFCRAKGRQIIFYCIAFAAGFVILYFVDGMMGSKTVTGEDGVEHTATTLRIKSQVDQILFFDETDEETLAAIGTGRGAQIIPKFELLYSMGKEWTGFGFLSREMTKQTKYIIDNEMYENPDIEQEVATGVESMPFQIILDVGYIGLIFHIVIFILLWLIVRRLPYSLFFTSTMLLFVFIGISGLRGLVRYDSLQMVGLAFAAVIMNEKRRLPGFDLPPERHKPAIKSRRP